MATSMANVRVATSTLNYSHGLTGVVSSRKSSNSRNGFVNLCKTVDGRQTQLRGNCLQISSNRPLNMRSGIKIVAQLNTTTDKNNWESLPSPSTPGSPVERNNKGWTDRQGREDIRLVAQLRNIALAAHDRSEMHAIIGVQRDNWNKLCLNTVNGATVAAAMLSAINGATPALSLSVAALLVNAGAGGLMSLANKFQPSQLAEEQRTAARHFKNLAKEIESTLLVDPRLREDAILYLEDKLARLEALDAGYPLPLTPVVLEKFPKVVKPSVLGPRADLSEPEMPANNTNGWTDVVTEDLKRAAEKLRQSDVEIYLGWARKKEADNLRLAYAAPISVFAAVLFNFANCLPLNLPTSGLSTLAAACSVIAMFCFSFSHGGQIGMIFEMYRNCAGAYADMDETIQRTIRVPVCQREDGELFHQKIALQLGRPDSVPLMQPGDKTAGKVF